MYGKHLAFYALAMLCLASGCFFASTSFMPSLFSMYSMSLSSGLFLLDKPAQAVAVAAVGVILGWPFSILAFLPVTLFSLSKQFKQAFLYGTVTSIALLALPILVDYYYYQRWTSSVFNLLMYNVLGGGENHLYGTPLFYLRNGFNNFNFCFIFALLFLAILPIVRKKYAPDLLIVVSPLYIWLTLMSLQLHKEESADSIIQCSLLFVLLLQQSSRAYLILSETNSPYDKSTIVVIAKVLRPGALCLILCASHARTFSLINGYAASFKVYKILDHYDDAGTGSVLCVGSEWHRFPSSFFVPDYVGEVRWINDGFQGLLPFPFNATPGGTSAAPPYFNNKNKASYEQYLEDLQACSFLVELQLDRPYHHRGNDLSTWEAVAALPYLDRELSPAKYRSFFIPYLWEHKNVFGLYKLLKRISKPK
ncbi:dol-P-Man:Man(6)GlcNAc(2)-PP-Dol alpha-1,2-mannosyltransferase-like isoform X1 [Hibiscus syriacus]|uniref:dol-P-Man:Man(6)GlcNAc(2)-PP-Dol alpha-1,2-mannosyltransferase-like isoform X1 n=1 Tax=Hibiscus syriacus TaxID=106335 RepID=UPI00192175B8|nr:dol-P-Man:Man(6)GlcNAc(2)-PP-Dol alpha-1,2-mannosyltransferase-like isoform X1 [Hibiscus syriacus]XP_039055648.1 dol-P-Man:Man(6)GlcNAc(2)-PP-Dol alpha-1,2-mannosyltransferase-like isoform X1 [Hibiscus syriacus]